MLRRLVLGKAGNVEDHICSGDLRSEYLACKEHSSGTLLFFDEYGISLGPLSQIPKSPLYACLSTFTKDFADPNSCNLRVCFLKEGFANFKCLFPSLIANGHISANKLSTLLSCLNQDTTPLAHTPTTREKSREYIPGSQEATLVLSREYIPESQEATVVLPYLIMGSAENAADKKFLLDHNLNYILNVTADLPNYFDDDQNFCYTRIPILDTSEQNAGDFFADACTFIEQVKAKGSYVFVHCLKGRSRYGGLGGAGRRRTRGRTNLI